MEQLSREPVDVLIIGGGIVGAGIARDAAMRGLRVVLVEKNDLASGTSSRSSRLLHGGIRYLAQGRIGLVREASVEKMVIHRIAPHLAAPLPFIFPAHQSGQWKYWQLRVGTMIYDWLCGRHNLGRSTHFSREELLRMLPGLNPAGLTGAVRYFDGFTNDARLVIDTLRSAHNAGAIVCNYVKFQSANRDGRGWQVKICDQLAIPNAPTPTLLRSAGGGGTLPCLTVKARCIVNAAGAWAEDFPESRVKLRLTKGVHLVIDRQRLPVNDAVVMAAGKRILFAIPWGQRVILGTTDTDYDGPTDSPTYQAEDVEYILDVANATFPSARLVAGDVISAWAGLRPLIADSHGKPSEISRRHQIKMPEPGWFDVAGGKLTTYRLMAEQTVDRIVEHTGLPAKKCATDTVPLLANLPGDLYSGILPPAVSPEAVEHYCRNEWAVHLSDVMIRRTSWRHYHADHLQIARQVAQWMGEILEWDAEQTQRELEEYGARTDLHFLTNCNLRINK